MICEVCHQEEEALRAKGQPVCASCASRLGIQADPSSLPRPRSATEVLPPPPEAARPSGGALGPVALALSLAAAGGAGWLLWQGRAWREEIDRIGAEVSRPKGPSATDVRLEALAKLQELELKLLEAQKAFEVLKDEKGSAGREFQELVGSLKEEARQAREESAQAREASEKGVEALSRQVEEVRRKLEERTTSAETPDSAPASEDSLAEQYWESARERAQALVRQGRFLAAAHEYDRIPKRQRKGDLERKATEARAALERQATARVDEALKSADQALSDGKHEYAEGLLAQLAEDCGFPSLLERIQGRLDEVRTQRRRLAKKEEEQAGRDRARVIRALVQDLAKSDPEAQRRAVDALKSVGPDAVQPMIQALDHEDARVRWGAVLVLGGLGSPDAVLPMAGRLTDKDVQVRLAAADLLAELSDPRAVPALIDALADPDENVARQAANSLERITHYTPPTVAKPADAAPAWRAWWESGRRKATEP